MPQHSLRYCGSKILRPMSRTSMLGLQHFWRSCYELPAHQMAAVRCGTTALQWLSVKIFSWPVTLLAGVINKQYSGSVETQVHARTRSFGKARWPRPVRMYSDLQIQASIRCHLPKPNPFYAENLTGKDFMLELIGHQAGATWSAYQDPAAQI